jgi:hypothetical protein
METAQMDTQEDIELHREADKENSQRAKGDRDLRKALSHNIEKLGELETAARKLLNQNFADLIAKARGALMQANEHPDLDRVHEHLENPDQGEQERTTHNQDRFAFDKPFPGIDPGTTAQSEEFSRRLVHADANNPDLKYPGDPEFVDKANTGFQPPDAVALNTDGTLRQAPQSIGAHPDVRKE